MSIKRQSNLASRTETEALVQKKSFPNQALTEMNNQALASTSAINSPLFLHYFSEKMSSETENYLFELPIPIKKTDINDIVLYIKNELYKHDRCISDEQLQSISQNFYNSKQSDLTSSGMQLLANQSQDAQSSYLYLNFLIKEIVAANKINNDFDVKSNDLESYIKFKIGNLKRLCREFNSCVILYI